MIKSTTNKLLITILTVIFVIGFAGCSSEKPSCEKQNEPVVIKLEGGDWGYPSPFAHYSRGPGSFKMALIFDSLLERGEKGYIPWLADKWEISEDGLTYTFTLRENVKWHDGTAMTAEDVKFSFEYFENYPPVFNDLTIDGESFIKSIETVDAKTARFTVEKPIACVLGKIGSARIIPKHIWEKVEDPRKLITPEAVIGTGPYKLEDYSREQGAYKFKAFKEFWGPKPKADVLQFVPVSDTVLAFEKGEIDLVTITPDILSRYDGNEEYKVITNPGFWGYRLVFNMEKRPELKDRDIRQAIAFAIDKEELVEKVARKAAVPGSPGYLPVDHAWYNNDVMNYEFNIDKAKGLLKGKEMSFDLLIAIDNGSNSEARIAELIKISLAKAGIEINVKSVDMKTRDATVQKKNYELALIGHGGWGGDADVLRTTYMSPKNSNQSFTAGIPGYNNEIINELCIQQLYEINPVKRKEIVLDLQELIARELPMLPLYNTTGYVVFRPEKYNGWKYMFNHHEVTHNKLSYLDVN